MHQQQEVPPPGHPPKDFLLHDDLYHVLYQYYLIRLSSSFFLIHEVQSCIGVKLKQTNITTKTSFTSVRKGCFLRLLSICFI